MHTLHAAWNPYATVNELDELELHAAQIIGRQLHRLLGFVGRVQPSSGILRIVSASSVSEASSSAYLGLGQVNPSVRRSPKRRALLFWVAHSSNVQLILILACKALTRWSQLLHSYKVEERDRQRL